MKRVPSAEFVRNFSALCDEALSESVVLTRNGRDRLVVANVEHYRHLLSLALLNVSGDQRNENIASELSWLTKAGGRTGG
jgi:PHD/YefM family antitoxin component YafN of YafNO toxin-antitoxin module